MTKTYTHMDIPFEIRESRYGMFTSYRTDTEEAMSTAGSQDACYFATTMIRIPSILGCFEGFTSKSRSATVDGKL